MIEYMFIRTYSQDPPVTLAAHSSPHRPSHRFCAPRWRRRSWWWIVLHTGVWAGSGRTIRHPCLTAPAARFVRVTYGPGS